MANESKRLRIWLLYAFMYIGGPILWGGWMIFRLDLLSPGDYVRCLLSPVTLAMLGLFLGGNLVNISRAAGAKATKSAADPRSILRAHCAAIVVFGTLGTFVFLVPLSLWSAGAGVVSAEGWLITAVIGALSGASLVFLVYGYFTVLIFRFITGNAVILQKVRRFYSVLFPVGAALFVTTAALAGRFRELTPLGAALLTLPLAMTGFLFIKTMIRTEGVRRRMSHESA